MVCIGLLTVDTCSTYLRVGRRSSRAGRARLSGHGPRVNYDVARTPRAGESFDLTNKAMGSR